MFAAWGTWVARFRLPVFIAVLAAVIGAGIWGMGVFGRLAEGGYNDPGSESTRAAEVAQQALGAQGGDVVVIYTPNQGDIDDPALQERVQARLAALPASAVTGSVSYWPDKAPQFASEDKSSAVALLTLAGEDDGDKLEAYREIADDLGVPGARTQVAGGAVLGDASAERSTRDLAVAEAISLPIVLILLLFVFGSLVAASLPVLVGGAAVLGSLGVLNAIALTHDVNSFAVNVASLLGLGMAIDYGLFMVGRFREEQSYGRTPAEAVSRTVATAGRTVVFSASLLMIALAGLMLFPQGFLKSLAYGGLAAVALAAILSLTLLPALLALLGPRVDKLPIKLPSRGTDRPPGAGWATLSERVLRRPVLVAVPILAGLLVLAAPIAGVRFGEADERVLPAGDPARQAIELLKSDYPALSSAGVQVVVRGAAAPDPAFVDALGKVPGVAQVTPAGAADNVVVLTATLSDTDPFSTAARDAVEDIRDLRPPPGTELLVGGTTARNVDSLAATADRLPLMIGLLCGATLILMFLAFGSILLPVKAVLMSALSLAATFGILVWIFQDGHGAGLLGITPAPPEVGIVVLMAAVVFGLSTDYEVFLLSRMVEARTRGATTAEAVTTGLARTGRVISAAALLLIVVTGAFALSSVTTMRFVGVGMIIALVLDATVVRMLLVPAVLGLLGNAAWWAPGPLRRLQERAGLAEYAGEELFPTVSVGRHAAPGNAVARSTGRSRPRHASGLPRPPRELTAEPAELPGLLALPPAPESVSATAAVPVSPVPSPAPTPAEPVGATAAVPVSPASEPDPVVSDASALPAPPDWATRSREAPAGSTDADEPAAAPADEAAVTKQIIPGETTAKITPPSDVPSGKTVPLTVPGTVSVNRAPATSGADETGSPDDSQPDGDTPPSEAPTDSPADHPADPPAGQTTTSEPPSLDEDSLETIDLAEHVNRPEKGPATPDQDAGDDAAAGGDDSNPETTAVLEPRR